jgi:hypothetical protein
MKAVGLFLLLASLLFAAAPILKFSITDGRGKETSAVTIEAGAADEDGWRPLRLGKAKVDAVIVWPFDGLAKLPDGPEPIPAIVIQRGEEKALGNKRVAAAIATAVILGVPGSATGFGPEALATAFAGLVMSADPFEKGVGLLYAGKAADAIEALGLALRQRQRQLTGVPSEIYPVAMLDGLALFRAGKFDASAVAYLAALKERPADQIARKERAEALTKAGKPEAAGR